MIFLINPKKKGRKKKVAKTKRKPPNGFRTWKGYMASIRPGAKKRSTNPMKRKKAKRKTTASATRTITKYKTRYVSRNAPKKRRKYRRNPNLKKMAGGFTGMLMQGGIDTIQVTLGKVAARTVPTLAKIPTAGPMGLVVQGVVAVLIGFVGHNFINRNAGKMMLAGALSAPVESIIKQANIPFISSGLGEEPEIMEIGAYPEMAQLEAYPTLGEDPGEYDEEEEMAYV